MQTILVCDDDKQIVEAIDIYLTGEGYEVIKAYDGYEVLDFLESHDAAGQFKSAARRADLQMRRPADQRRQQGGHGGRRSHQADPH